MAWLVTGCNGLDFLEEVAGSKPVVTIFAAYELN
jgi:hypothetical protein